MPPVLSFACQEPENDPKNFVYLWLCRSWTSEGEFVSFVFMREFDKLEFIAKGLLIHINNFSAELCQKQIIRKILANLLPLRLNNLI